MGKEFRSGTVSLAWRAAAMAVAVLFSEAATSAEVQAAEWRADHHVHLASVDLCSRVGECLDSHDPPAVLAADAVRALDEAHVAKGVVLSCAYLYGMSSLQLSPKSVATWTRRENEFTAEQVARYPSRLVGFLSVDPLRPSAIDEIQHWRRSRVLVGLKLHFAASSVSLKRMADRLMLAKVLAVAGAAGLPLVIHVGGGDFDAASATLFIRDVLPAAADTWVQIAHAGGGVYENQSDHEAGNKNLEVLKVFADHIERGDPATRKLLFDLAYVPFPQDSQETVDALVQQMRRIGFKRFLFGSDFNVLSPAGEIKNLSRLKLTQDEVQALRDNCAPWAC